MDCRVPTPPRSAFGESGFRGRNPVERGGPKAGQGGRFHLKPLFRVETAGFEIGMKEE